MVVNKKGNNGRLFWIVNIIWGTSTSSLLNLSVSLSSPDLDIIGPAATISCEPIFYQQQHNKQFWNNLQHNHLPSNGPSSNICCLQQYSYFGHLPVCLLDGGWLGQRSSAVRAPWVALGAWTELSQVINWEKAVIWFYIITLFIKWRFLKYFRYQFICFWDWGTKSGE